MADAVAHIRGKGVEVTEPRMACDNTTQAWVDDPNGVKIELFQYSDQSAQFVGGDREADW
jgi:glyoxylase I family protein